MYSINKLALSILALTMITASAIVPVYADNSLEGIELHAKSAIISLEIKFGEDIVKQGLTRDYTTSHLDDVTLMIYGKEIPISEPKVKVSRTGDNFRISSIPDGIMMYGHKNTDTGNYDINIYLASEKDLNKFSLSSIIATIEKKVIETKPVEERKPVKEKEQYIPDLKIASSHDYKTYWNDNFNIDVQAFDAKVNSKAVGFEGRLDNASVNVIISHEDTNITLSGITKYGEWMGEYYFAENVSTPGEYTVNATVNYLNQSVSKSSSMFVIGIAFNSGGADSDYDNDGIPNNGFDGKPDNYKNADTKNDDDKCPYEVEDFKRGGEMNQKDEVEEGEKYTDVDGCFDGNVNTALNDYDDDKIPNSKDNCPYRAGMMSGGGCPPGVTPESMPYNDYDEDKKLNNVDMCPYVKQGTIEDGNDDDLMGCLGPITDYDGDKIPNMNDMECMFMAEDYMGTDEMDKKDRVEGMMMEYSLVDGCPGP